MRTILIIGILGLVLGFLGCTQKEETTEDDQEITVEDNAKDSEGREITEEDEKHIDDPADMLQELTF